MLAVDLEDTINEYEDEDESEQLSMLLRKPIDAAADVFTFSHSW